MKSAAELAALPVPDISYLWGDLLRPLGRMAIIGAPKDGKSFYVLQMGLHIATGTPFLGMNTAEGVVLYVNYEISEEKLQERVQDISAELGMAAPENLLLASVEGLALNKPAGKRELEKLIMEAIAEAGRLDVLIIDPRRNSMDGDENQSEVMTAWCHNLDDLRTTYNLAIAIVHHTGKSTTGAGRGSSVFDGWLDTITKLKPSSQSFGGSPGSRQMALDVQGRDSEQRKLNMVFDYPVWRLSERQAQEETSRAKLAEEFIVSALSEEMPLDGLRRATLKAGHSEYAFKTALKRLADKSAIKLVADKSRQGNWKKVRLQKRRPEH